MTDRDATSATHYLDLVRALNAWMRMLMRKNDERGLMECGAELKWLSVRAGLKA